MAVENIKTIRLSEIGSSLGTRDLAARLRTDVLSELNENDKIIFDFDGVNVVTNSFANEYFGKLISEITIDRFRDKFAFINANDFVQRVLISSF